MTYYAYDQKSRVATFWLTQVGQPDRFTTVRRGDSILGRFEVVEINKSYVRVKDDWRKPHGTPRLLDFPYRGTEAQPARSKRH